MPSKFILAFLRVAVTILFYILILATLWWVNVSVRQATDEGTLSYSSLQNGYEVNLDGYEYVPYTYSKDSIFSYQPLIQRYNLRVKVNSPIGYYTKGIQLIIMLLSIGILWNFMKIFIETKLDNPFRHTVTKRIKILAILFIIIDVLKLVDYFFSNHLLKQSLPSPRFELHTQTGYVFVTGLIIWIIAVIYQRGIELQDENTLTV